MVALVANSFTIYQRAIEAALQADNATEHTHRPALKALVESMEPSVVATNEPKREECGAPDFSIARQLPGGFRTIGHIEAKNVGASLDDWERSDQLVRYRSSLANLLLTDYLEFRWYVDGDLRMTSRLAHPTARGQIISEKDGAKDVALLFDSFLAHKPEPIRQPRELATRLAKLSHMIRDIVVTSMESEAPTISLTGLYHALEEVLFPELAVPDFADMFAQTLTYGLFAARCSHQGPASFERYQAVREIPKANPFLRKLFAAITGPDLDDEPFAGFVDDLVAILADADMSAILHDFGKRTRQEDPVVHFYETFLSTYDPKLRESRGVYYTPEPVVSYIVRSVDQLLRAGFNCSEGLADSSTVARTPIDARNGGNVGTSPRVLILDPACGTGTFLYSVVDQIRQQFIDQANAGKWEGYVRDHLLRRLFGFELLMAPYAVAHLKLGMQFAALDLPESLRRDWAYDFDRDDRLGVFMTNSLEGPTEGHQLGLGAFIQEEANAASEIKRDLPVMVVLGNPPYSGHSYNASWRWVQDPKDRSKKRKELTSIGELIQAYYFVDGHPLGERNSKWLQDDYVKFLRFGQWRIERTGAGILAFITNHAYLDNPTFGECEIPF